jgi:hypothetical protein
MNVTVKSADEIIEVVDAITNFFEVKGDLSEDDIAELHESFVEFIELANSRLTQCDQLLRKGLRGEAIQEAEIEPSVFDLVSALDFEDWDNWKEFVTKSGFAPQPDLLLDVAAEVNEEPTAKT